MILTMKIQILHQKNGMLWTVSQKVIIHKKNPIKFLTSSLESNLCDYSDAYI